MAKKTAKKQSMRQRQTRSKKRKGAGSRAARSGGARPAAKTRRKTGRKTASARTPRGTARKSAKKKSVTARRKTSKAAASRAKRPGAAKRATRAKATGRAKRKRIVTRRPAGGSGRERTLAQTPETGRTVKGPTNPMPTKRSTGSPAGAGSTRRIPGLDRQRRQLREIEEEEVQTPPSSLDMDRMASAARTGCAEMHQARREHTESSPVLTGGDVDANWQGAYAEGDEAPGGDNPTPDQDRVDDIGKALGVTYEDNEELKASDKIAERDRHRWELDPASSEDYRNRDKDLDEE